MCKQIKYRAVYRKIRKEKGYSIVANNNLELFFLDDISTDIYMLLLIPKSIEEIVNDLLTGQEYDINIKKLTKDVKKLLNDLLSIHLLEVL